MTAWSFGRTDDGTCPGYWPWVRFWNNPPTSLDDPRLTHYLDAEAAWTVPLEPHEQPCPHCLAMVGRLRALIADLERADERST